MVLPHCAGGAILLNADRTAELERIGGLVPPAAAARLLDLLTWCEQATARNVDAGLMLANLLLTAGGHLPADPFEALPPTSPGAA
jgi:hypothetical protein